jgi:hypothetical protein
MLEAMPRTVLEAIPEDKRSAALAGPRRRLHCGLAGYRASTLSPRMHDGSASAGMRRQLPILTLDRDRHTIGALDPGDRRLATMWVAGADALLVATTHKIAERVGDGDRVQDRDVLDMLLLLRAARIDDPIGRLRVLLDSKLARPVTDEALELVTSLLGTTDADASPWLFGLPGPRRTPVTIAGSLVALVDELQDTLENQSCRPCAVRSA